MLNVWDDIKGGDTLSSRDVKIVCARPKSSSVYCEERDVHKQEVDVQMDGDTQKRTPM